jgi:cytochrome c5
VIRAVVLVLLLGACSRSTAPHATDADATRAALRWPGTTTQDLEHGRDLYVSRCSSCHLPPTPSEYSVEAWPGHIAEMRERAHLDEASEEAIRRYVVTMAGR